MCQLHTASTIRDTKKLKQAGGRGVVVDQHAKTTAFWYQEHGACELGFTRPNSFMLKQLIHNLFQNV